MNQQWLSWAKDGHWPPGATNPRTHKPSRFQFPRMWCQKHSFTFFTAKTRSLCHGLKFCWKKLSRLTKVFFHLKFFMPQLEGFVDSASVQAEAIGFPKTLALTNSHPQTASKCLCIFARFFNLNF